MSQDATTRRQAKRNQSLGLTEIKSSVSVNERPGEMEEVNLPPVQVNTMDIKAIFRHMEEMQ